MVMCGVRLQSQRRLLLIRQGLQISRFSGDPARGTVSLFKAGPGCGGRQPPAFPFLNILFDDALLMFSNFCDLYFFFYKDHMHFLPTFWFLTISTHSSFDAGPHYALDLPVFQSSR